MPSPDCPLNCIPLTPGCWFYSFKKEIENDNLTSENYSRILAFVYAIRNAYAHNGETARSGTEHYISKLLILTAAFDFTLKFSLRTDSAIYEELISKIS